MFVWFSILKISDGTRNLSLWYLNCTCLHTATDHSVYMKYTLIQCIRLLFSAADLTEYQSWNLLYNLASTYGSHDMYKNVQIMWGYTWFKFSSEIFLS